MISSKSVYENKCIKSAVIQNISKLEGIESEAFRKTDIQFITIPESVAFLDERSI
jgi:hypothetical protein